MKKKYLLLGVIFFIAAAAYANSIGGSFHYDDYHSIVFNPNVKDIRNIPKFFTNDHIGSGDPRGDGGYRPVVTVSLAINYFVSGIAPWSYHLLNLILHCAVVFAVFLLSDYFIQQSGGPWRSAFLPALLFALNPVQTNAVSYVIARSAILCTLFYVLSFYFYLRFREGGRGGMLAASSLSFVMALLSKEIAITLPVILFLYELLISKKKGAQRFVIPSVFLTVAGGYAGARLLMLSDVGNKGPFLNTSGRFFAIPWLVVNYLKKLIFPVNLNFFPVTPKVEGFFTPNFLFPLAILASSAAIIILLSRRRKQAFFFMLWFLVALMPELILNLREQMVEYRLYLPSVGPIALLGVAASRSNKNYLMKAALTAAIASCFFTLTLKRNEVYRDDVSLWSDAANKSPQSALVRAYLGVSLLKSKHYADAAKWLSSATKMDPQLPGAGGHFNNLGLAYENMGEDMKAYEAYFKALTISPDDPVILKNMGRLCMKAGMREESREYLMHALRINPQDIEIRAALVSINGGTN